MKMKFFLIAAVIVASVSAFCALGFVASSFHHSIANANGENCVAILHDEPCVNDCVQGETHADCIHSEACDGTCTNECIHIKTCNGTCTSVTANDDCHNESTESCNGTVTGHHGGASSKSGHHKSGHCG